jgi:tetratricopeptide (TPR) repeat protein
MAWQPSNEPVRYDRKRVATFGPVTDAVGQLGLPLIRFRKLNGICNAIAMQIEDGGDSPEANRLLLEALRAAVIHQVGERAAAPVMSAIETFRRSEAEHWARVRSGNPLPLDLEELLDDLVEKGCLAHEQGNARAACDFWLAAWKIVQQLAQPNLRTASAFYGHYGLADFLDNWSHTLLSELYGLGLSDPGYHERRLQFGREFLAQFPDESPETHVNFIRAQGEALWELGRRGEAEAVYAALVARFPDDAWGYIGWADHYWLSPDSPKEYARAESIMTPALARAELRDRNHLLERLRELYTESGQRDKLERLDREGAPGRIHLHTVANDAPAPPQRPARQAPPPGRNDPCWCGSGKKYKRCHLQADRA